MRQKTGFWGGLSALICFSLIFGTSCKEQKEASHGNESQKPVQQSGEFTVAFYNVENLFDTQDDPKTDDEDFTPNGYNHWSEGDYQQKLSNLAEVISELGDPDGPEILGLCEIENRQVLEDLIAQSPLQDRGYEIVHQNSPDHRGIDVALLAKTDVFNPESKAWLTVELMDPEYGKSTTRDILRVTGTTPGGELSILVNHWPSRRGGEAETDYKRATAAKVARAEVDRILAENPQADILLMGDFNDEPTDASLLTELAAAKNREEAAQTGLFNTMYPLKTQNVPGTYRYKGEVWNLLDQIVVSKGLLESEGLRWKEGSSAIYNPPFMREESGKYKEAPLKGVLGGHFREIGQSDHFPVYTVLEY